MGRENFLELEQGPPKWETSQLVFKKGKGDEMRRGEGKKCWLWVEECRKKDFQEEPPNWYSLSIFEVVH